MTIIAACSALTAASCSSRPTSPEDFATIEGTLKSFEEKRSLGDSYLEIYINESPLRFRVPVERYSKFFRREAFFAKVHAGSTISMKVEKKELEKPVKPLKDGIETVFIQELKDPDTSYLSRTAP